jgi:hypothetical protein
MPAPIDQVPDNINEDHTAPAEGGSLAVGLSPLEQLSPKTALKIIAAKAKKWCEHCEVNHFETTNCPWLKKQEKENPGSVAPQAGKPSGTSKPLPGNLSIGSSAKIIDELGSEAPALAEAFHKLPAAFSVSEFVAEASALFQKGNPSIGGAELATMSGELLKKLQDADIVKFDPATNEFSLADAPVSPSGDAKHIPPAIDIAKALLTHAWGTVGHEDGADYAATLAAEVINAFGKGNTLPEKAFKDALTHDGFNDGEVSAVISALSQSGILKSEDGKLTLGQSEMGLDDVVGALTGSPVPPGLHKSIAKGLAKFMNDGKKRTEKQLVAKIKNEFGFPLSSLNKAMSVFKDKGVLKVDPEGFIVSAKPIAGPAGGNNVAEGAPVIEKTDGMALAKSLKMHANSLHAKALTVIGNASGPMSPMQIFAATGLAPTPYADNKLRNGLDQLVDDGVLKKTADGSYFFGHFATADEGAAEGAGADVEPDGQVQIDPTDATPEQAPSDPTQLPTEQTPTEQTTPTPTPSDGQPQNEPAPPAPVVTPDAPDAGNAPPPPPPVDQVPHAPVDQAPDAGQAPPPADQETVEADPVIPAAFKPAVPVDVSSPPAEIAKAGIGQLLETYPPTPDGVGKMVKGEYIAPELLKALAGAVDEGAVGTIQLMKHVMKVTGLTMSTAHPAYMDAILALHADLMEKGVLSTDTDDKSVKTPTAVCPDGHATFVSPAPHNCPTCGKVENPLNAGAADPGAVDPNAGGAPDPNAGGGAIDQPAAKASFDKAINALETDHVVQGYSVDQNDINALSAFIKKKLQTPDHEMSQLAGEFASTLAVNYPSMDEDNLFEFSMALVGHVIKAMDADGTAKINADEITILPGGSGAPPADSSLGNTPANPPPAPPVNPVVDTSGQATDPESNIDIAGQKVLDAGSVEFNGTTYDISQNDINIATKVLKNLTGNDPNIIAQEFIVDLMDALMSEGGFPSATASKYAKGLGKAILDSAVFNGGATLNGGTYTFASPSQTPPVVDPNTPPAVTPSVSGNPTPEQLTAMKKIVSDMGTQLAEDAGLDGYIIDNDDAQRLEYVINNAIGDGSNATHDVADLIETLRQQIILATGVSGTSAGHFAKTLINYALTELAQLDIASVDNGKVTFGPPGAPDPDAAPTQDDQDAANAANNALGQPAVALSPADIAEIEKQTLISATAGLPEKINGYKIYDAHKEDLESLLTNANGKLFENVAIGLVATIQDLEPMSDTDAKSLSMSLTMTVINNLINVGAFAIGQDGKLIKNTPTGKCPDGHATYKTPLPHNCPTCGKVYAANPTTAPVTPTPGNAPPAPAVTPTPGTSIIGTGAFAAGTSAQAYELLELNPGGKGITFLKHLNSTGEGGITLEEALSTCPDPMAGTKVINETQAKGLIEKAMKLGLVIALPGTSPTKYLFGNFGQGKPPRIDNTAKLTTAEQITAAQSSGAIGDAAAAAASILIKNGKTPISVIALTQQLVGQVEPDHVAAAVGQLVQAGLASLIDNHAVLVAPPASVTPASAAQKLGITSSAELQALNLLAGPDPDLVAVGELFGYSNQQLGQFLTKLNNAGQLDPTPSGSWKLAGPKAPAAPVDPNKATLTDINNAQLMSQAASTLGWNPTGKGMTFLKGLNKNGEAGASIQEVLNNWTGTLNLPSNDIAQNFITKATSLGLVSQVPGSSPAKFILGFFGAGTGGVKPPIVTHVVAPPPPPPEPKQTIVTLAQAPLPRIEGPKKPAPQGHPARAYDVAHILGFDLHDPAQRTAFESGPEGKAVMAMSKASISGQQLQSLGLSLGGLQKLINAGVINCHVPQEVFMGGNVWENKMFTLKKIPKGLPEWFPPAVRKSYALDPSGKVTTTLEVDPEVQDAIDGWVAKAPPGDQQRIAKFLTHMMVNPTTHQTAASLGGEFGLTMDDVEKLMSSVKYLDPSQTTQDGGGLFTQVSSSDIQLNVRTLMSASKKATGPLCGKCKVRHKTGQVCPFAPSGVTPKDINLIRAMGPKGIQQFTGQMVPPPPAANKTPVQLMEDAVGTMGVAQGSLGYMVITALQQPQSLSTIASALTAAGFSVNPAAFIQQAVEKGAIVAYAGKYALKGASFTPATLPGAGQSGPIVPAASGQPLPGAENIRAKYASDHPMQRMAEPHARYFDALVEHLMTATDDSSGNPHLLEKPIATRHFGSYASAATDALPGHIRQCLFDFTDSWCGTSSGTLGRALRTFATDMGCYYENSPAPVVGNLKANQYDVKAHESDGQKVKSAAQMMGLTGDGPWAESSNNGVNYFIPKNVDEPIMMRVSDNDSIADIALKMGREPHQVVKVPGSHMGETTFIMGPTPREMMIAQNAVNQVASQRTGCMSFQLYRGVSDPMPGLQKQQWDAAKPGGSGGMMLQNGVDSWTHNAMLGAFGASGSELGPQPNLDKSNYQYASGMKYISNIPTYNIFATYHQKMLTPYGSGYSGNNRRNVFENHMGEHEALVIGHDSFTLTAPGNGTFSKVGFSIAAVLVPHADSSITPGFARFVCAPDGSFWYLTHDDCAPVFVLPPADRSAIESQGLENLSPADAWLAEQAS